MKFGNKKKIFLKNFCNFEGFKNLIITFDVDWAPEFMIEDILYINKNINLKIFNTHKSKLLNQINKKRITLGIHPNLQNNSSHGKNIIDVKNFVQKVGNIKFLRFHILGYSYPDLKFFASAGSQIDSSIILMNQPYLFPNYHNDIDLVKVPYTWEDGMVLNFKSDIKNSINLKTPGIKILNFHPLDVYLNTYNTRQRLKFKNSFSTVLNASKKETELFINKKHYGIRNFLIDILKIIKNNKIKNTNFEELNYEYRSTL